MKSYSWRGLGFLRYVYRSLISNGPPEKLKKNRENFQFDELFHQKFKELQNSRKFEFRSNFEFLARKFKFLNFEKVKVFKKNEIFLSNLIHCELEIRQTCIRAFWPLRFVSRLKTSSTWVQTDKTDPVKTL